MSSKNSVLISEFTYDYVKDRVEAIAVGSRQFKGKQKEVMVYEIISLKDSKTEAMPIVPSNSTDDSEPSQQDNSSNQDSLPVVEDLDPGKGEPNLIS